MMSVRYPNVSNIWERERCVPLCVKYKTRYLVCCSFPRFCTARVLCSLWCLHVFVVGASFVFWRIGFSLEWTLTHTNTHVLLPEYASVCANAERTLCRVETIKNTFVFAERNRSSIRVYFYFGNSIVHTWTWYCSCARMKRFAGKTMNRKRKQFRHRFRTG